MVKKVLDALLISAGLVLIFTVYQAVSGNPPTAWDYCRKYAGCSGDCSWF